MLDLNIRSQSLTVRTPLGASVAELREDERNLVFLLLDSALMCISFSATLPNSPNKILIAILATILFQVGFSLVDYYGSFRSWSLIQIPYETIKGLGLGLLILAGLNYVVRSPAFYPEAIFPGLAIAFAGLVGWRLVCFRQFSTLPVKRTIIIGAGEQSRRLLDELGSHQYAGFELVGFVEQSLETRSANPTSVPTIGTIADLSWLPQIERLDTVLVDSSAVQDSRTQSALYSCVEQGLTVLPTAAVVEKLSRRVRLQDLDDAWFVLHGRERQGRLYERCKRLLDILVALIGLVLTSILLPFVALGIRFFGGPGPIFYSQIRLGLRGQEFRIYKFRTMYASAERDGARWASVGDQRITPFGRFLRTSRLDEFPQFLNVLLGHMSVVGPRPERPEFVSVLDREIPYFNRRHLVMPGLTGWAQVKFPYGASVEDAAKKLEFDLYYIKNRSFFLDLTIMFKTVSVMFRKFGSR